MEVDQRYELITKRVTVRNGNLIREKLRDEENIKGVWGTAPTGRPHIGYFVPFVKLAEFVAAGVDAHIMFADTYAFLVNYNIPMEQVAHRTKFYQHLARAVLQAMKVPLDKVTLAVESESHSYTPAFMRDEHKLYALVAQSRLREISDELRETARLSPLLCPVRQALLGAHYGVDFELGGVDQVGCYSFTDEYLPKIGHKTRGFLLNPLLPGLQVTKMSSSHAASTKIDFLDSADVVLSKISSASCPPASKDNPILSFLELVIIPLREIQNCTSGFFIQISDSNTKAYQSYSEVEHDYLNNIISVMALKSAVADAINELLEPVRHAYASNPEWQAEDKLAYPEEFEADRQRQPVGSDESSFPPPPPNASESASSSSLAAKELEKNTQSPQPRRLQKQKPKPGTKSRFASILRKLTCTR